MKLENFFYIINSIDIITTTLYWSLESNPLVLQIGMLGFLTIKFVSMFIWWLGFRWKESEELFR